MSGYTNQLFTHPNSFAMRMVQKEDLHQLEEHRNQPEVWGNLTSPLPVVQSKQQAWFESLYKNDYYFIAMYQNLDIGLLRATDIDWVNRSVCVGVDIFKGYRGKGFSHPAFALVVDYCFNVLNMHRLWLLVLETNTIAIGVYEKAGFEVEGRMKEHIYRKGKYLDYILMGKINE